MSPSLAFGVLFAVVGLVGVLVGLYALLRGGRGQRGGIGPLSERGIHVIAGVRMFLIGVVCLTAAGYLLLGR